MQALVIDAQSYARRLPAVLSTIGEARAFATLPILLVSDDDWTRRSRDNAPDVDIQAMPVEPEMVRLLAQLDRAGVISMHLDSTLEVGGVTDPAQYPVAFGEPVGSEAPPAICAAVNLSQTPPDDHLAPLDPFDLVNLATRSLSVLTVPVVAAGNHHSAALGHETVSPWAEPDWVLSVGATADVAGTVEWSRSGRGSARRPEVGPDVLAWGQSGISADPEDFGTSFAAPRVSFLVALTRAWILQVVANIDRVLGHRCGVPLVGIAVVDRGARLLPGRRDTPEQPALPVLSTRVGTLDALDRDTLMLLGGGLAGPAATPASRALLMAAVRATTPSTTLSAPVADGPSVRRYLDELTMSALLDLGGVPAPATPVPAGPVFDAGTAERLDTLLRASMPIWNLDIDEGTSFVSFQHWMTITEGTTR